MKSLGEFFQEEFDTLKENITDPIERFRARHAVYENQRTLEAIAALKNNDLEKFGKLMKASHMSLCEDYDVIGIELDTLAELAWTVEGCISSRMTGASFGGSSVSIVKNSAIKGFKKIVK